jgi:predicted RND superfamily exporter protein
VTALVRALARLGRRVPAAVIVVVVLLTAVLGALAGQQETDQSQEAFSPDNAELAALEFAGEAFEASGDTLVQVLVRGDDVVSPAGLETVARVREAVTAALPEDQLGGQPGQGPVVSYLAPVEAAVASGRLDPSTADDAAVDAAWTAGLESLPPESAAFTSQLVAGDERTGAGAGLALVFLDTDAIVGDATGDAAVTRTIDAVRAVTDAVAAVDAPLDADGFAFELFFQPDDTFQREVGRLFGIAALVIVLILFTVYLVSPGGDAGRGVVLRRAAADTGLTLFTILASITWMQGIGVLLGPDGLGLIGAFSPPTQVIPILLIGLGVDYAIHLTSRYREEVVGGAGVDVATGRAIQTVGVALVLATITTSLGFLTNVTNPVPAIRDFGILAAVGIGSAFLLMMTFVPAVRTLLDRRGERRGTLPRASLTGSSRGRLSALMARASVLAERTPGVVLSVTLVLGALGGYGLTQLSTEFSFADFVPDDSPVRETFVTIEEEFGGGFSERTQVVLQGDVARPRVHNATVEGLAELGATPGVRSFDGRAAADSPVSILQEVVGAGLTVQGGAPAGDPASDPGGAPPSDGPAVEPSQLPFPAEAAAGVAQAAMREGFDPQTGTFPPDADVAAVYDTLLDAVPGAGAVLARDDTGAYVGAQVAVQTQSSVVGALTLRDAIEADFAGVEAAGVDVVPTGNQIVSEVIVASLSSSQVSSLAITLLAALGLLVVTFWVRDRRPALGALTTAPVALVVLWVFGTMAATGIPFGPVTAMISALAIGIGVPFTIHITHRFTEDLERTGGDIDAALQSTMRHTGGALAGSAFTTMAGFLVLVSSSLVPFRQLGLVTAYAIGFSLLAAVIVLPSLLALWARWHRRRGAEITLVEHEVVEV